MGLIYWRFLFLFFLFTSYSICAEIKFIPNKGQWDNESLYRAEIPNGYLYILKDGLCYQFYELNDPHKHLKNSSPSKTKVHDVHLNEVNDSVSATFSNIFVKFKGGKVSQIQAAIPSEDIYNYFIGNDENKWAGGLHSYGELLLKNVYQGISLRLYFSEETLKYDWKLEPEADASLIKMEYLGAEKLTINNNRLNIVSGKYTITENAPFAFVLEKNLKREVPCFFKLTDKTVSFNFPHSYDNSKALTIDPKLIFSSYTGSRANNWGNTATYDEDGNLYTGGTCFNSGFPLVGAFHGYFSGGFDVVIMKFSSDGKKIMYSTYLGGLFQETPHSMIVNKTGELLVLGTTSSRNFPVRNGYDLFFNGGVPFGPLYNQFQYDNGSDMFIVRFSEKGNQLLSGTFLGGSGNDGTLTITTTLCRNYGDQFRGEVNLDNDGNVLISSKTQSSDFPVVNGTGAKGGFDGILTKFKPDLSGIIFSTYLGGSSDDAATGVCSDAVGNIYVCGGTASSNFSVSTGPAYAGEVDAFIQKYSSNGTLLQSRLTGTASYDQAYFIDLGSDNSVYIFGQTLGTFPIIGNVYANPNSGQFIQKFDSNLSQIMLSTTIGTGNRRPNISPTAFLVNECDMIYLSGWGGTANENSYSGGKNYVGGSTRNMPIGAVAGQTPYQKTTDGSDFYLMVLDENASRLLYSTYFGGADTPEHVDGGTSRFDKKGNVYHCVCACFSVSDFPTTPGVVSNTNNSPLRENVNGRFPDCNNAAFKFDLGILAAHLQTYSETNEGPGFKEGCAPLRVNIKNVSSGGVSFKWSFGDGTSDYSGFTPTYHIYENPGVYKIQLVASDLATCMKTDTATTTITVNGFTLDDIPDQKICIGDDATLTSNPIPDNDKIYNWTENKMIISDQKQITVKPAHSNVYHVSVKDTVKGCILSDSAVVTVSNLHPNASVGLDNGCDGLSGVHLINGSKDATSTTWTFGDGTTGTGNVVFHHYEPGSYTVYLASMNQSCKVDTTFNIEVSAVFVPNVFTPNNDGLNDRFEVTGHQGDWKLVVYNRWGKQVAKFDNYTDQWDGNNEAAGVYYYQLTSPYGKVCKGWVQIIK